MLPAVWWFVRIAAASTLVSLVLGLWAARATQRHPSPVLKVLFAALLLVPADIILVRGARSWEVVLAGIFSGLPLLLWGGWGALRGVDPRYENAARSLGASEWRVFWRVALPLAWR